MRVKINKEIRDYTENIYFGLSLRQFIFSVCACLAAVTTYININKHLGTEVSSWLCIFSALPFAILGFVKYNGMTAEQLLLAFLKTKLLVPHILNFKDHNIYNETIVRKESKKPIEDTKKFSKK